MWKKENREIWQRILQPDSTNDNENKPQKEQPNNASSLIGALFFGLMGVALLILLIVFSIVGDSAQNLITLGVFSGICFIVFILYLFVLLSDKSRTKLTDQEDNSNTDT